MDLNISGVMLERADVWPLWKQLSSSAAWPFPLLIALQRQPAAGCWQEHTQNHCSWFRQFPSLLSALYYSMFPSMSGLSTVQLSNKPKWGKRDEKDRTMTEMALGIGNLGTKLHPAGRHLIRIPPGRLPAELFRSHSFEGETPGQALEIIPPKQD